MYTLDRFREDVLDQDSAVRQALEATDTGLFDSDPYPDDDVEPVRFPARHSGAPGPGQPISSEAAIAHMTSAMTVSSTAQARWRAKTGASSRAP